MNSKIKTPLRGPRACRGGRSNPKLKKIASLALAMTLLATFVPLVSAANYDQGKAVAYLKAGNPDDWSVIALGTANSLSGVDINFLKADPGTRPTDIEKRILAILAAGQNPDNFNPAGLLPRLTTFFNGTEIVTMSDPTLLSDDVFGLLALAAAQKHSEIRNQLANFIKQNQNPDGGWSHFKNGQSNADYTAMAAYALIVWGEPKDSLVINRAFDFLATTKKSTGYSHFPQTSADPYTTSWVIPVFKSSGRQVPAEAVNFLTSFQKDNGSFDNSALLTAYAVIALNNLSSSGNSNTNPPPANNFAVNIISPTGIVFTGSVSFENVSLQDSSGTTHNFSQPVAIGTITEAAKKQNFAYVIKNTSFGLFVESIAGVGPQGDKGWMYAVNGTKPSMGAASYVLKNQDSLIWFYGSPFDFPPSSALGGQTSQTINLSVNILSNPPAVPAPTISLSASKTQIKIGETVELSWSTQNATKVASSSPNNWAGNILSGTISVQPSQATTYTIRVEGSGGTAEKSITVNVNQTPSIVFGVDKTNVNFGNLKPGETAFHSVRVTNQGSAEIKITASLENADNLYQGLSLNNISWQNYQTELSANFAKTINLTLQVSSNYQGTGQKNGTLILWASPK